MTEQDFKKALAIPVGKEHWSGNVGLKRVPNGLVMMFYDASRDCISGATYIPIQKEEQSKQK